MAHSVAAKASGRDGSRPFGQLLFPPGRAQPHPYHPLETFSRLCYHQSYAQAWSKRVLAHIMPGRMPQHRCHKHTNASIYPWLSLFSCFHAMQIALLWKKKCLPHRTLAEGKEGKESIKWDWTRCRIITSFKARGCRGPQWALQQTCVLLLLSQLTQTKTPMGFQEIIRVQIYSQKFLMSRRSITSGRNSVKKVIHGWDELANFLIVTGQRKEEPSQRMNN